MHRRRIGMSHSLLLLILSSLLITTCAIPRVPDPPGIINVEIPTIIPPQDVLPGPHGDALNIDHILPQLPIPIPMNIDPAPALPQPQPEPQPQPQPQPQDPLPPNMDEKSLAQEFLDLHNFARRHAKLPPFVWDVTLEEYAKQYATQRANSGECQHLVHSMGPYGENLFWGRGTNWKPKDAVKKWIKEHRYYDQFANECKNGKVCGHYTQVVWRDSIKLGCAVATCPNSDTLTVCSYDPPGNYLGEKPSIHYTH